MSGCPVEDLELYVRGELDEDEAARVAEHVRACPVCGEEAAWLRAEERLFKARAPELPGPPPFAGVLARLATEPRAVAEPPPLPAPEVNRAREGRPRALRVAALVGLAAAAAVLGLLVRAGEAPPVAVSPEPAPAAAIGPYAEEPDRAAEPECNGGCGEMNCAGEGEANGACGERGVEPEPHEGNCDLKECAIDISVTCSEDRPLEE